MADPLSIAASIAGLISLADIVFTRLIKYKKSVKDAEKELGDLAKEVNLLGGALNSLARLARALEAGSFDSNLRMHNIEDCSDSLTAMDKELSKIDLTSIRTKLFRPISTDQVREWLDLLSRHKQNINLALSADSMDAMLKLLAKEDEHVEIVKDTRRITIRIDKAMEDKRLLDFYVQHNPQQNYDMSLRLRHGRTGLWLTRLPQFQRWLSNPDSRLWLKGIPGAGKTVLAASIVEATLGKCTESIACAFFFCDYKVSITQNIDTILLAIVYQLGLQKMEAYDLLKHHYEKYHPVNGLPRQPGEEEVKAILHRILKMYDHVYLVIDGLDECGKHTTDVTSTLAGISGASTNVSIALLSRDEDEVRYHLHEDFVLIEVAAHKQDIIEYVTTEIEERTRNGKLDLRDPELKAEALSRLVDGANGMFRWVACQLDHLAECDSAQECRDALQSLPPTLNETYIRILERIPPKKIRIVQLALHAIAFVVPPLNKRQLQHLLSVPPCGSNFDHRRIIREEAITKYCSSLIRQSADRTYFEFSHFSVQEFLEGGSFTGQQLEVFRISSSKSDSLLAVECLKYLLLGNFARLSIDEIIVAEENGQRRKAYPLYLHAAISWQDYASGHWENPDVNALARTLFDQEKTSSFCSWAMAFLLQPSFGAGNEIIASILTDPGFTPLHMAALLSLPQVCSYLLHQGVDANLQSPMGSPLQCAIQGTLCLHHLEHFSATRYWSDGIFIPKDETKHLAAVDTVICLQHAGASLRSRCTKVYPGKSLLEVAFSVAYQKRTLLLPATLVQLGVDIDEDDICIAQQFFDHVLPDYMAQRAVKRLPGLEQLIASLDGHITNSAAHLRLYSIAWEKAVDLNENFTRDITKVNTALSLTLTDLTEHALAATRSGNLTVLRKILQDSRITADAISDGQGGSLLHMALREQPRTQPIATLRVLLDAGCDALKMNSLGKQPMHVWNWSLRPELFADAAQTLADRGALCSFKDLSGRNVLHNQITSKHRMEAVLKFQSKGTVEEAMQATDNAGHTPLSMCLSAKEQDSAVILAMYGNITPSMMKIPTSFLRLVIEANAEKFLDMLPCFEDAAVCEPGENPLQHLGSGATLGFIRRIKNLYPKVCDRATYKETVLQAYVRRCLASSNNGTTGMNSDILNELSISDSIHATEGGPKATWEQFAGIAIHQEYLKIISPQEAKESSTLMNSLLRLGYFEAFEESTGKSGLGPVLDSAVEHGLQTHDPIRARLCDIIRRTKYWAEIKNDETLVYLLEQAFHSKASELAELLLQKGVSIHARPSGAEKSVLELALNWSLSPAGESKKKMIDLALGYTNRSRLNDPNPAKYGRALIHVLIRAPEWLVRKLVGLGVNPNLRIDSHPYETLIIHHLLKSDPDGARSIFKNGGDPTLTDDYGFDGALAAAYRGSVSFLEEIAANSTGSDMNWSRVCSRQMFHHSPRKLLSGLNALHLGAAGGSVDTLKFYLGNGLLQDVNVKAEDGFTPLHLATIRGHVNAVEYLCSRGCNVNSCTEDGSSALHYAARAERLQVAKVLFQAGCKPSLDEAGLLPSFYAPKKNRALMKWFQSIETKPAPLMNESGLGNNLQRLRHQTMRHEALADQFEEAVFLDDIQILEDLRDEGYSFEMAISGCKGCSPLIRAVELGQTGIVRWLLQNRADITREVCHWPRRISAMHLVLRNSALNGVLHECLECYASGGGSFAEADPGFLVTAVHFGNVNGLRILLETFKNSPKIEKHSSPTQWSVREALTQVDSQGRSPLHCAAFRGDLGAVKTLLKYGADVNTTTFNCYGTPLGCAIRSRNDKSHAVALLLIKNGANLNYRDRRGQTALLQAVYAHRVPIIRELINANVDPAVTDYDNASVLDLLKMDREHSCSLFSWALNIGIQIHKKASVSYTGSPFHHATCESTFTSFILNSDIRMEESSVFPWNVIFKRPSWITNAYSKYLRRFGRKAMQRFANLTPSRGWSPLCIAASRGEIVMMKNIMDIGADINYEGCPYGTALMAACIAGQKECVEHLIRGGALVAYQGVSGYRSAYIASEKTPTILHWLLVQRFLDQKQLSSEPHQPSMATEDTEYSFWSGHTRAELVISGMMERLPKHSSQSFWSLLMNTKEELHGKILPTDTGRRTTRSSNLIPTETVRIHTGGYSTPDKSAKPGPQGAPKMVFDGLLWYTTWAG